MIFTSSLRKIGHRIVIMRKAIARQAASQIVETIAGLPEEEAIILLAPRCAIEKAVIKSFEKIKK